MHKRISISLDKEIVKKVDRYMKGRHLNFSQALEEIISKIIKK